MSQLISGIPSSAATYSFSAAVAPSEPQDVHSIAINDSGTLLSLATPMGFHVLSTYPVTSCQLSKVCGTAVGGLVFAHVVGRTSLLLLCSVADRSKVMLFNCQLDAVVHDFQLPSPVKMVSTNAHGDVLIISHSSAAMFNVLRGPAIVTKLWDDADVQVERAAIGHGAAALVVASQQQHTATSQQQRIIFRTSATMTEFPSQHKNAIGAIAMSTTSPFFIVATTSVNGTVIHLHAVLRSGNHIGFAELRRAVVRSAVTSLSFSHDGHYIACAGPSCGVSVWKVPNISVMKRQKDTNNNNNIGMKPSGTWSPSASESEATECALSFVVPEPTSDPFYVLVLVHANGTLFKLSLDAPRPTKKRPEREQQQQEANSNTALFSDRGNEDEDQDEDEEQEGTDDHLTTVLQQLPDRCGDFDFVDGMTSDEDTKRRFCCRALIQQQQTQQRQNSSGNIICSINEMV
eukprot:PhM_4_TR13139/c0_g1_i1/m.14443